MTDPLDKAAFATPSPVIETEGSGEDPCDGEHCCCCGPGEPCCDCGLIMPDREELPALRRALTDLLRACQAADAKEDLSEDIDGELMDAAEEALELQYPIIWTSEQVELLNRRQAETMAHPYTCGNRSNDERSRVVHQAQADEDGDTELGLLIPTIRGWICPACDYRQFWAHEIPRPAPVAAERSTDREAVARIIDPDAWHKTLPTDGCGQHWMGRRKKALAKASAILALRPVGAENVRESALDGLVVEWRDRALKAVEKLGEAKGLLSVIADVADIVNAHIDEATYTDRRKLDDWSGDHEFDLSIPWYMVRDLNDVICKVQRWLKEVALITPTAGNGEEGRG